MYTKQERDRIGQYIEGSADESTVAFVESLFLYGEDNQELRNDLGKDWEKMMNVESASEADLSRLLDRIHHTIRKKEAMEKQKPLQKLLRGYMKAAAVLLLPLLITSGLVYNYVRKQNKIVAGIEATSTIYAPIGAKVSFSLPDGTKGMLNSGSFLSYSIPFNTNRKVKLEGEAWLDVRHDEKHPFCINTGKSTVKVLGTSLNVNAYSDENYVEVVLFNGRVEFINDENNEKTILIPSERLIFKKGNVSKSVTDPEKYKAWTEGKLVFKGDRMAEVARRIERWYNVKVILADNSLEQYSFRATFQDDPIEEVLQYLSMTSPIRYTITPRAILPDGTFTKQVITLYIKNK
jgi:ferric-dicitrate binding protein FerR (iron transport regulator)